MSHLAWENWKFLSLISIILKDLQRSSKILKDPQRSSTILKDSQRSPKIPPCMRNWKVSSCMRKLNILIFNKSNPKRSPKIHKDPQRSPKIPKDPQRLPKTAKMPMDAQRRQGKPWKGLKRPGKPRDAHVGLQTFKDAQNVKRYQETPTRSRHLMSSKVCLILSNCGHITCLLLCLWLKLLYR